MHKNILTSAFIILFIFTSCQSSTKTLLTVAEVEKACLVDNRAYAGPSPGLDKFCKCAAPLTHSHFENDAAAAAKFKNDEYRWIFELTRLDFVKILDSCQFGAEMSMNPPTMERHMTQRMEAFYHIQMMTESTDEFKATHDMDQYIKCYIEGLKYKFSMREFTDKNLENTEKYKDMMQDCEERSRL